MALSTPRSAEEVWEQGFRRANGLGLDGPSPLLGFSCWDEEDTAWGAHAHGGSGAAGGSGESAKSTP